ncbi:MAG TPA: glutamate racemase [Bacillales bacterium]
MDKPIGVIDSGVGGLTVARELARQLPKEEIIYFGDTIRCPYGSRPREEVREFTWEMTDFLLGQEIKMLVVACNTATAIVLDEIREQLDIPVVGVVHPGARSAIKVTRTNQIAVIGTTGTIKSGAYEKALKNISDEVEVESLACPRFVPLVEKGQLVGPEIENAVGESLKPLKSLTIDTLILGCTHYPLLRGVIRKVMGPEVNIICSGAETAREVSTVLYHSGLLYTGAREPDHRFYTSGPSEVFTIIASQWMDRDIIAESVRLPVYIG